MVIMIGCYVRTVAGVIQSATAPHQGQWRSAKGGRRAVAVA